MQSPNHFVQRPLSPIEDFDPLVVGDDHRVQIARQRLAHVYEGTEVHYWAATEVVVVGAFILTFWALVIGGLYLLTPYIVAVME